MNRLREWSGPSEKVRAHPQVSPSAQVYLCLVTAYVCPASMYVAIFPVGLVDLIVDRTKRLVQAYRLIRIYPCMSIYAARSGQ